MMRSNSRLDLLLRAGTLTGKTLAGAAAIVLGAYLFILLISRPPEPTPATARTTATDETVPVTHEELALRESPLLKDLADRNQLPALADRIGPEPVVLPGKPGRYGGDLWLLSHDIDGVRLFLQYSFKGDFLMRYGPEGLPLKPHMAAAVEPSVDFRVWTVRLRKGTRWSDGHPFTSDDFIWWATHVWADPEIGNLPELWRSASGPAWLEVLNPETFRVHFPDPVPNWASSLAAPAGGLYMPGPRHYLEQFHPRLGNHALIQAEGEKLGLAPRELFLRKAEILNPERPGLGPWLLKNNRHQGPWSAVRNPYYPVVDEEGRQLPYIDRLVFRQVSTPLQPRAYTDGLASFSIDVQTDYPSLMQEREKGHYDVQFWYPLDRSGQLIIPNRRLRFSEQDTAARARAELLRSSKFRQALSLAINRQAIITGEFNGRGEPASLGPGPRDFGYDPEHLRIHAEYNPAKANALLDDLGLTRRDKSGYRMAPDGSRLVFEIIARPGAAPVLEFLTDFWGNVGLHVIAREKPHRLFMIASERADFQAGNIPPPTPGTVGSLGADAPFFQWLIRGGLSQNPDARAPGIAQPDPVEDKALRLADQEQREADPTLRLTLSRELMRIAQENVWTVNVLAPNPKAVLIKKGLKNVPTEAVVDFNVSSPFNAYPEKWYWERPDFINGTTPATATYSKNREQTLVGELTQAAPQATIPPGAEGGNQRLISGLFAGVGMLLVLLAAFRHPYFFRRLALMVPTLAVISIIVFVGVQLPPGNYLDTVIDNLERQGNAASAQPEVERLQKLYHLNDSLPTRYLRWVGIPWFFSFDEADEGLLQGNLGRSMANGNRLVSDLVGDRILLTMALSLGAILIQWIVALPIGVYSAVNQNTPSDYAFTVGGLIGMCIPDFVLALLAILVAKEFFGIVAIGMFSTEFAMQPYWDWPKFLDLLKHIWIPALIIGTSSTAGLIRIMRANLLEELRKPYVTTARAKGVRPFTLLMKYPFRLALNPFVASIGGIFPILVSGSAIVSIILSLPTVGPMLLDSVMLEDTYMAGSLLLCLSALSILGILVSDLLLLLLDPRIRFGGNSR